MRYWAFALNPNRGPRTPVIEDDPLEFSYEALLDLEGGVEWDWIDPKRNGASIRYLRMVRARDGVIIYNTQGIQVVKGFAEAIEDYSISPGSGRPCVRIKATERAKRTLGKAVVSRLKKGKGPRQLCVFPIAKGDWNRIRHLAGISP